MKYDLKHCINLVKHRKLILICDLDETLISSIYLNDNYLNPNLDKSIVVSSPKMGSSKTSKHIHIKLRPYLNDFLEKMSNMFELHLMSMGNFKHVKKCVDIIDPTHKYFGDRITSREDIVDSNNKLETRRKMFPQCNSFIIALDDNVDVWKNSSSVLKIKPLNYFDSLKETLKTFPSSNEEKVENSFEEYVIKLEKDMKDDSLLSLQNTLEQLHSEYFKIIDKRKANKVKAMLPCMKDIIKIKKLTLMLESLKIE